jgi:hypothetical protein
LNLEICTVIRNHDNIHALSIQLCLPNLARKAVLPRKARMPLRRSALILCRLWYVYPSDTKKSAESCIDTKENNIDKTELKHVNYRSWPTLSSPNLSRSHSKSHDAFYH